MKRITKLLPGYDCYHAPCKHEKKGDHGCHGDEWHYFVVAEDGMSALSLTVFTANYPATVPLDRNRGSDLTLHVAFWTDPEDLKSAPVPTRPCSLLVTGACADAFSSGLQAEEFFSEHGIDSYDQPETLWLAMEERFAQLDQKARAARADLKWARCTCCNGQGIVAKEGVSQ